MFKHKNEMIPRNLKARQRVADALKQKAAVRKRINDAFETLTKADLKRQQSFRRVIDSDGRAVENVLFLNEDGTPLAVLTNTYGTASTDKDVMTCYTHAGQHSLCTYDYAATLPIAKEADYAELLGELESVGYSVTALDKLPEEKDLQLAYHTMMDSYKASIRKCKVEDNLKRGDTIERDGKRGVVQYALYDSESKEATIGWKVGDSAEEFIVPIKDAAALRVRDDEADTAAESDTTSESADTSTDTASESEVTDDCGGGKKKFKIFKRGKKE